MGLIWTVIIGVVIGAIAKWLMPGKDGGGFFMTMVLGIAGSFVGTWLGRVIGLYSAGERAGFIGSIIGAVIVLWVYRKFFRDKA